MVRERCRSPADDGVPAVYLVPFHRAELSLAARLLRLRCAPSRRPDARFRDVDWDKALGWLDGRRQPSWPPSRRRRSGWR